MYLTVAVVAMWIILHGMYVDVDGSSAVSSSGCLQRVSNESNTDPNSENLNQQASNAVKQLAQFFGIGNGTEVGHHHLHTKI